MTIREIFNGDLTASYERFDDKDILDAEVDILRRPDGGRCVTHRDLSTGRTKVGEVPADDKRSDDDLVNDVFFTSGKVTKPAFRRRT